MEEKMNIEENVDIEETKEPAVVNNTYVQEVVKILEKDVKDIEFVGTRMYGNDEQLKMFMTSFAQYFSEVTNPKNTKMNAFLKNKYAPLDEVLNAIREVMGKHGLSIMQIPTTKDELIKVDTLVMHKDGSFMSIEGLSAKPAKSDIQSLGSVITYLRRYQLSALCGVASEEDDDGNTSTGKKVEVDDKIAEKPFASIKAKVTALAKSKMTEDKTSVNALIVEKLGKGKAISKTTEEEDKDKLIELYNALLVL